MSLSTSNIEASLSHVRDLSQIRSAPPSIYQRTLSPASTGLDRSKTTPDDHLHPAQSAEFVEYHGTARYLYPWSVPHDEDIYAEARSDPEVEKDTDSIPEEEKSETDRESDFQRWPSESLQRIKTTRSRQRDPFLVTFNGPDDPENPKNWSKKSKWAATLIVSLFTFISPVSSSMAAPALEAIGRDLNATNQTLLTLSLSIFVLAYALGPLFLGPLSEIYGRIIVLQTANAFFLAFNIGCGFAQTLPQLIVFRFFAGIGGSAPLAIGGGVLSDLYASHERGKAVSIYSLMPLLGPAIGPIAGGFIALRTTWRWCFWATSILTVVVQALGLIYLRETFPSRLLGIKAKKLRKETGESAWHTQFEKLSPSVGKALKTSLVRPFILLGTQPIVQAMAVYQAYLYGLLYLVLTTFPTVFRNVYGFNTGIAGLNYISLGLGFFVGAQVCAFLTDRIYRKRLLQNNNVGKPEYRIPLMIPGACLVPIGLFIYGWTSDEAVHWIAPNIGAFIFSMGSIMTFQCTQTYVIDSYQTYAASAIAATTTLRSLAGFGFPLFASNLYDALGLGWGNSLLAFLGIAIGIPAPLALWRWGEKLRSKSQFAAG